MRQNQLKPFVFFVPFVLLAASMVYSLANADGFLAAVRGMNEWILRHFGWLFASGAFLFVVLCVWTYFSPLAKVRIGGAAAKPVLTRWQWFSIILCTTIAIGILFWGTAEPLYHLHHPPQGEGIAPDSRAAVRFAMSTMFMHWTFTPYSIYTLAGLMFALAYYNFKQPFSLGSMLYPVLGARTVRWGPVVDAICLYSLVAGMAASLGAGTLTIAGGLERYFGVGGNPWLLGGTTVAIVAAFVISSITGLTNGIRSLSNINTYVFFTIAGFALLFGPTRFLFSLGAEGMVEYVRTFVPRSLGLYADKTWAGTWTIFYWANWLAWAPVTAAFLGRMAVGYTVRDFIHFNLVLPSLFGVLWMAIFSGNALYIDFFAASADLYGALVQQGPENVVYAVFDHFPWSNALGIAFFATAFLSYVAGADANTSAMGGLCSTGISPDSPESPSWIKIAWGGIVGLTAWVMVAYAGIDGIKMASNLGGYPALLLILAVAAGLIRLLLFPRLLQEN